MTTNQDAVPTDTAILDLTAVELLTHLRALRRGEPMTDMHRALAFECLDALADGIK